MYKLIKGDCLEHFKEIADESVDLVLVDPPYGTIQGLELKRGLYEGGIKWDVIIDTDEMMSEISRVLRYRGVAIIFGNNSYTQLVRSKSTSLLKYIYPLYWRKDNFANSLLANKAPVSLVEDMSVFRKQYSKSESLRNYARLILDFTGKRVSEFKKELGHGRLEHFLSGSNPKYIQFSLPTSKSYDELTDKYNLKDMDGYLTYKEMKELSGESKSTFNLIDGKGHVPNIFDVQRETDRYHPTQKPVELLEKLISIYTDRNDVVLDFAMGSGSTGVASMNLGRQFIGIEIDDEYFNAAKKRVEEATNKNDE